MNLIECVAGSVSISPLSPCVMGCGDCEEATDIVRDSLEVNILLIKSCDDIFAVISIDALYLGSDLRNRIEKLLIGIALPTNIFISASHTHYAPMLDTKKPFFGDCNLGHLDYVEGQIKSLLERLIQEGFCMCYLEVQKYQSNLVSNRRRKRFLGVDTRGRIVWNKVWMQPSRKNPRPTSYKIEIRNKSDGFLVAVIWQLACHPTSLPYGKEHSSHFVAHVRDAVRRNNSAKTAFLFLQGFSGDLRPPAIPPIKGPKGFIRHLLLGSWYTLFTEENYQKWLNSLWREYSLPHEKCDFEKSISQKRVEASRIRLPADLLFDVGASSTREITFQKLIFSGVTLFGVSGELVSHYSKYLENQFPDMVLIPVGCIDDVIGYFPTDEMIAEGGYESFEFLESFGLKGITEHFEENLKKIFMQVLSQ